MSQPFVAADLQERHAALAAPSRVRLMSELRGSTESLNVDELAARTGLHHNTVRFHLGVLAAVGLVERHAESRGTAGRPRHIYTVTRDGDKVDGEHRYMGLAGVFAAFLSDAAESPETQSGERVGRFLGRTLGTPGSKAVPSSSAARQLNDLMTDLGFESELRLERNSYRLMLHHCPYSELAVARPDVICGLHLGLLKQVVEQMNTPAMEVTLHPFVAPRLCVADLVKPGASQS